MPSNVTQAGRRKGAGWVTETIHYYLFLFPVLKIARMMGDTLWTNVFRHSNDTFLMEAKKLQAKFVCHLSTLMEAITEQILLRNPNPW